MSEHHTDDRDPEDMRRRVLKALRSGPRSNAQLQVACGSVESQGSYEAVDRLLQRMRGEGSIAFSKRKWRRAAAGPSRRFSLQRVRPVVLGLVDELAPFALAHLEQYDPNVSVEGISSDVEADLHDAADRFFMGEPTPRERRAALLRLVARGVALLALDEVQRGSAKVEREAAHLDALGYPGGGPR